MTSLMLVITLGACTHPDEDAVPKRAGQVDASPHDDHARGSGAFITATTHPMYEVVRRRVQGTTDSVGYEDAEIVHPEDVVPNHAGMVGPRLVTVTLHADAPSALADFEYAVTAYDTLSGPARFEVRTDGMGTRLSMVGRRDVEGIWQEVKPLLDHDVDIIPGERTVSDVWDELLSSLRRATGACVEPVQVALPDELVITIPDEPDLTARDVLTAVVRQSQDALSDGLEGAVYRTYWDVRYNYRKQCTYVSISIENLSPYAPPLTSRR